MGLQARPGGRRARVTGDDARGELRVAVDEGAGGHGEGGSGELGEPDELVGELVEVVMEGVAHGCPSLVRIVTPWEAGRSP